MIGENYSSCIMRCNVCNNWFLLDVVKREKYILKNEMESWLTDEMLPQMFLNSIDKKRPLKKVPFTKCPFKIVIPTKHPCIQNVLIYKTSAQTKHPNI